MLRSRGLTLTLVILMAICCIMVPARAQADEIAINKILLDTESSAENEPMELEVNVDEVDTAEALPELSPEHQAVENDQMELEPQIVEELEALQLEQLEEASPVDENVMPAAFIAQESASMALNVQATSLVRYEDSLYTLSFTLGEDITLAAGTKFTVTFPADFGMIGNGINDANPGYTLATVQYKNEGDKFYSILHGKKNFQHQDGTSQFTFESDTESEKVKEGTAIYLILPGVTNGEKLGSAVVTMTVQCGDKIYTGETAIELGVPPAVAPENLVLTASKSLEIDATWDDVAEANRYRLYYSLVPNGVFIQAIDFGVEPEPAQEEDISGTGTGFTAKGNGYLEPGRTYYFQVRAGNEYGFGPPSPTVKVTTPALEVDKATPYANQWGVSVDQDIKVIFNQPIKLLDADKVQVYEKVTGKPLPKEITIDQQQMTIVVALAAATDYQVVFYEQALEGTEYTEIYNTIMGWDFTTKQQSSGGSKSRSKGGSKVEIPKTEVPTPTEPIKEENPTKVTFNDIQAHWAQKDIEALAAKGIIKGITAEYYAPEESINRAQFATLLVRCLDLKEKTPHSPFNDVKQDDWHYDSVTKAHAHGIVRGVTTDNFDPAGQITREQMAVMMANALKYQDINITVDSSILNKFTDQQQISPWAVEACAMVVQYEIMQGANDIFMPSEITTRAQSAAVLNRFIELMTDQRGAN